MFQRFTERARRVIVLAQDEARAHDHNFVATEHILLGIVHERAGVAVSVLTALGVSLDDLRADVDSVIGHGSAHPSGQIPFTPQAKKVLELSLREALQLADQHIGTEHLLLGLLGENDGAAAQVLRSRGVRYSRVRAQIVDLRHGAPGPGPEPSGPRDLATRLEEIVARLRRIENRLRAS
jgi:ATP-dependent Clp protease ATP-binding subunit ClpC